MNAPSKILPFVFLLALACSKEPSNAPTSRPQAPAVALEGLRFTDVTAGSGIVLENVSGDPVAKLAIPENLGQGGCALDYDGDGRLDLFVANGDVLPGTEPRAPTLPALYRNIGGFRFEDVTEERGLAFQGWCHGASAVDFDADGDPDLYVTVFRGPNRFFENTGGTFVDATARWGGADEGPSTAAAFFDADDDGDLDLYVGNYVAYDPDDPPNGGEPCEWKGLAVSCGPKGTPPAADHFYENRDGALVEATDAFGFGGVKATYALGAVTGDVDGDGDLDLYVANDSAPNFLFVRDSPGRFHEAAFEYGVDRNEDGREQAGMGVDLGDVDNDGRFDLFVTNFSHDTNALYHSGTSATGATLFKDTTYVMQLGRDSYAYLSWGTRITDLDADGWQDLVVVSGHVYPQVDSADVGTTYAQRNQVFRNLGAAKGGVLFETVAPPPGDAFEKIAVSRGLVLADLDDDGDSDMLVVEMDAPPTLIRNDTAGGHWVGFLLVGAGKNRDAIGARLSVEDSAGVVRWRERVGGGSYLSTGDPRILVGLGEAARPLGKVVVRWPSGETATYEGLAVDRYWVIEEGSEAAR